MMTPKQRDKLVDAVRAAMEQKQMTQKDLALFAGTSTGNISTVLSKKGNMSEVKWQMACDALDLDYQKIIAEDAAKKEAASSQQPAADRPAAEIVEAYENELAVRNRRIQELESFIEKMKCELGSRQTVTLDCDGCQSRHRAEVTRLKVMVFDLEHPQV